MGSSSSLTAVRARSKRFSEIRPSSKYRALRPTQQGRKSLADHHFRRTAADVDDQTLVGAQGAGVHDARVDEPPFLLAGDDFDRMPERGAGALEKPSLALRAAQGAGADHAHAVRMHGPQPLPEAFEAAQGALRGGVVEAPAFAQSGGQAHHFPQSVQDDQLAVGIARDDQVEAVASQVDGREHVGHGQAAAHQTVSVLKQPKRTSRSRRWFWRWGCE